jgi:Putative peptidoglycan binding domain
MLTNLVWRQTGQTTQLDRQIQSAFGNTAPMKENTIGTGVAVLRKALQVVGFEPTLDLEDRFGVQTKIQIEDFQSLYDLPIDGTVGKKTLQKLDDILEGRQPKKIRKIVLPNVPGVVGRDFALKYLDETTFWVKEAIRICDSAESLTVPRITGLYSEAEIVASNAFLFHFRVLVDERAAESRRRWKFKETLFLDQNSGDEVKQHINKVKNVFLIVDKKLADAATIFLSDDTNRIAWTPEKAQRAPNVDEIKFSRTVFVEKTQLTPNGMDPLSASWVTVHEMIHLVLDTASHHTYGANNVPLTHGYTRTDQYYKAGWQDCRNNPDSFASLAYHARFKRPIFGPYV